MAGPTTIRAAPLALTAASSYPQSKIAAVAHEFVADTEGPLSATGDGGTVVVVVVVVVGEGGVRMNGLLVVVARGAVVVVAGSLDGMRVVEGGMDVEGLLVVVVTRRVVVVALLTVVVGVVRLSVDVDNELVVDPSATVVVVVVLVAVAALTEGSGSGSEVVVLVAAFLAWGAVISSSVRPPEHAPAVKISTHRAAIGARRLMALPWSSCLLRTSLGY